VIGDFDARQFGFRFRVRERTGAQKLNGLLDRPAVGHDERMRRRQHNVRRHAFQFRPFN
jgi:hypothetical protein